MNKHILLDPLSPEEMKDTTDKRVETIRKEFVDGFDFIQNHQRSVSFFGSARLKEDHPYYEKARRLAHRITTELKYAVVSGGGPGIMEAANRGAKEVGGDSLGLNIRLPHEQKGNPYLTHEMNFTYFFTRKVCLSYAAEAYLFFPGGFGTMDEFFEIITLIQTGKIPKVPLFLVGKDFWRVFHDFVINTLMKEKTISPEDIDLYKLTDDEDLILETIRQAPIRNGIRFEDGRF